MTTKAQVMQAAAELGCTVEDMGDKHLWSIYIDAPHGFRLTANACHVSCTTWHDGPWLKAHFWDQVMADIIGGIEPCDNPKSQDCIARGCFSKKLKESHNDGGGTSTRPKARTCAVCMRGETGVESITAYGFSALLRAYPHSYAHPSCLRRLQSQAKAAQS